MAGSTPVLAPAATSVRSSHTRQLVLPSSCPTPTHALLYYAYRHVADPDGAADEQAELCARLQVRTQPPMQPIAPMQQCCI